MTSNLLPLASKIISNNNKHTNKSLCYCHYHHGRPACNNGVACPKEKKDDQMTGKA